MKIATETVQDTGLGLKGEDVSQAAGAMESGTGFKGLVDDKMQQENQLAKLKQENELKGLSDMDRRIRMQAQSPCLVTIHRRIMADGSFLITEMKGSTLVSHYRKRLVNTSMPSKLNKES